PGWPKWSRHVVVPVSLAGHACGEEHGEQHRGVCVMVRPSVDGGEVRRVAQVGEGEIVPAELAPRRMRREAVERDRPRPVAALAEPPHAPRHSPDTGIEDIAMNGPPAAGADDPMRVAG